MMLERLAEASWRGRWGEDAEFISPAQRKMEERSVRAVMEALRTPSEGMLMAGYKALIAYEAKAEDIERDDQGNEIVWEYTHSRIAFTAMIDAALNEGGGE
jgi:hypothetical protein